MRGHVLVVNVDEPCLNSCLCATGIQGIGAGIRQGCQRLACNWLGRTERRRQRLCCRGWRRCRWTRILLLLGLFLLRSGHAHFAGTWHLRMQYRCSVRRTAVLACTWSIHCSMARSSAWHVRAGGAHHLESAGGTARRVSSGKRPSKAASLAPTPARLYKRTISDPTLGLAVYR